MSTKTFCKFHKIRIPESESPFLHPSSLLLPFDHPIRSIIEDNKSDIQFQTNRSFQVSEIHHEPSIARDTGDISLWKFKLCTHGRRESRSHRREGIIEDKGIGLITRIVPRNPDLIESIIKGKNICSSEVFSKLISQLTWSYNTGFIFNFFS